MDAIYSAYVAAEDHTANNTDNNGNDANNENIMHMILVISLFVVFFFLRGHVGFQDFP